MPHHENKICQRCKKEFECKVGNITQCQCFGIQLNEMERLFIEKCYSDCLCRHYIDEMKKQFALETKPLPLQENKSDA